MTTKDLRTSRKRSHGVRASKSATRRPATRRIRQQVYEEIKEAVLAGSSVEDATEKVALRLDRPVSTVYAWYYAERRADPDAVARVANKQARQRAYQEIKEAVLAGSSPKAAAEKVARRLGRPVNTVRQWYTAERRADADPVILLAPATNPQVRQQAYQEIKEAVLAGSSPKAAAEKVARRLGQHVGTVSRWYHTERLADPDAADKTASQQIRQQAYQEIKEAVLAGSEVKDAIAKTARRLGRPVDTLRNWYGAGRRADPNPASARAVAKLLRQQAYQEVTGSETKDAIAKTARLFGLPYNTMRTWYGGSRKTNSKLVVVIASPAEVRQQAYQEIKEAVLAGSSVEDATEKVALRLDRPVSTVRDWYHEDRDS